MGSRGRSAGWWVAALALAMAGVFLLDIATHLGFAVPILYAPVLVASARLSSWRVTWIFFAACVALTLLATVLSPPVSAEPIAMLVAINRAFAVGVAGIVAWLALATQRAEARRREAYETLWLTLRNSPVSVSAQDEQLRYIRVFNPRLGASEKDVLGKTDLEILGEASGNQLITLKRQVLESGRGARAELPVTTDGQTAYYDAMVEPTVSADGRRGITCVVFDVTQRRLAEEALRCSEEQLRQFVEQVPAAVAMFDRNHKYLAHSRRWVTQSFGREDNFVGKDHYEVFPNIPERWKEAHRRGMAGEIVRCERDEFIGPDGQQRFSQWEVRPWYDREGRVGGILILVEMITEQTQIEQRLRDSEALYRSLVENLPESVWRKDLEGRYTFANRTYLGMLGKSAERVVGTKDEDHFPPELAEKYRNDDRRVAETGSVLDTFEDYRAKDGSLLHIRTVKTPVVDADGRTVGTQGIFWDITDKRSAEEALRRSEREFRALAENLPDVVARYDRDLRHVYVNRAIERVTGLSPEAFMGKTRAETISPELVQQFHAAESEVLATGEPRVLEFTYPSAGGHRHFECRMFPEFASDGSVESILSISRDVTERVRSQEQVQSHLAQLAHVSRLSTIGELVSEIAHEINQPLHAIVNFAQASINVLEKTPSERRANLFGWLMQISEQANRAAEIIRRARKFVRKTAVNRSSVSMNELVRDCLKLVNFDLRLHQVKLRCELADNMPLVLADAIQVQQVLVNLLRNAVEAMSDNAPDDRRLLVRTMQSDGAVQVSVRDNGRGVAQDDAPRLFEPFFTTKPDGMGMGLAVSQSIVQAHNGRLWAEPNADRGVTFHFTLPIRTQEPSHVYSHA